MWATVRAWVGSARPGRCKFCNRPMVWVITDKGKHVPFNLGFTVQEVVTHPVSHARFTVLRREDRHDCPERRAARRQKSNIGSQRP